MLCGLQLPPLANRVQGSEKERGRRGNVHASLGRRAQRRNRRGRRKKYTEEAAWATVGEGCRKGKQAVAGGL